MLKWLVSQALAAFPPPKDEVLHLVVDSMLKGKRTKQNPLVKTSRLNEYAPYSFGLHVVILTAQRNMYCVPLAFQLVKPKSSKGYRRTPSVGRCSGGRAARLGQASCSSGQCDLSLAGQAANHSR